MANGLVPVDIGDFEDTSALVPVDIGPDPVPETKPKKRKSVDGFTNPLGWAGEKVANAFMPLAAAGQEAMQGGSPVAAGVIGALESPFKVLGGIGEAPITESDIEKRASIARSREAMKIKALARLRGEGLTPTLANARANRFVAKEGPPTDTAPDAKYVQAIDTWAPVATTIAGTGAISAIPQLGSIAAAAPTIARLAPTLTKLAPTVGAVTNAAGQIGASNGDLTAPKSVLRLGTAALSTYLPTEVSAKLMQAPWVKQLAADFGANVGGAVLDAATELYRQGENPMDPRNWPALSEQALIAAGFTAGGQIPHIVGGLFGGKPATAPAPDSSAQAHIPSEDEIFAALNQMPVVSHETPAGIETIPLPPRPRPEFVTDSVIADRTPGIRLDDGPTIEGDRIFLSEADRMKAQTAEEMANRQPVEGPETIDLEPVIRRRAILDRIRGAQETVPVDVGPDLIAMLKGRPVKPKPAKTVAELLGDRPEVPEAEAPLAPAADLSAERQAAMSGLPESVQREHSPNKIYGDWTEYIHPGDSPENAIKVRYVAQPLSQIKTSHDGLADFAPTSGYDKWLQQRVDAAGNLEPKRRDRTVKMARTFDGRFTINKNPSAQDAPPITLPDSQAITNNRLIAHKLAARDFPEQSAAYDAKLQREAAEYGIDPSQLKPGYVLTREVDLGGNVNAEKLFAERTNGEAGVEVEPANVASSLASSLRATDPRLLDDILSAGDSEQLGQMLANPELARRFSRAFESIYPNKTISDSSGLTPTGKDLFKRVLYFDAIGDEALAKHIATDEKGVRQKVDSALVQLARVNQLPNQTNWGLRGALKQVLRLMAQGFDEPGSLNQTNLLEGREVPKVSAKAGALHEILTGNKVNALRDVLKTYADTGEVGGDLMMGNKTPGQFLLDLARGKTGKSGTNPKKKAVIDSGNDVIGADMGAGLIGDEAPTPKPEAPKPARDWDLYSEELRADLDSFSPARHTGSTDYELMDVADKFIEFAKNDESGKPLSKLVSDFANTGEALNAQIRKLRASIKNLEQAESTPVVKESLPTEKPEVSRPWEMSATAYLAKKGVHEPWIGEISPMQMGMMSRRGKAKYGIKRDAEWAASMAAKQEWRDRMVEAYNNKEFDLESPDVHPEAKRAIEHELRVREAQAKEDAFKEASTANRITSIDQVKVGDRLFDIMTNSYGTVVKKFQKSVSFKHERELYKGAPETSTIQAGRLQRKSYDDLKADTENSASVAREIRDSWEQVERYRNMAAVAKSPVKEVFTEQAESMAKRLRSPSNDYKPKNPGADPNFVKANRARYFTSEELKDPAFAEYDRIRAERDQHVFGSPEFKELNRQLSELPMPVAKQEPQPIDKAAWGITTKEYQAAVEQIKKRTTKSGIQGRLTKGRGTSQRGSTPALDPELYRNLGIAARYIIGRTGQDAAAFAKEFAGKLPQYAEHADHFYQEAVKAGALAAKAGTQAAAKAAASQPEHEFPTAKPRQEHTDHTVNLQKAKEAHDDLKAIGEELAKQHNGRFYEEGLKNALKSTDSVERKLTEPDVEDGSQISDYLRMSAVFHTEKEAMAAYKTLSKKMGVNLIRAKNRIDKDVSGYRDILANVKLPNGHVAELQLHIDQMIHAKDTMGHLLYELERNADKAARTNSDPALLAYKDKIRAISKKFYDANWKVRNADQAGREAALKASTFDSSWEVLKSDIPSATLMDLVDPAGEIRAKVEPFRQKTMSFSDRKYLVSGESKSSISMSPKSDNAAPGKNSGPERIGSVNTAHYAGDPETLALAKQIYKDDKAGIDEARAGTEPRSWKELDAAAEVMAPTLTTQHADEAIADPKRFTGVAAEAIRIRDRQAADAMKQNPKDKAAVAEALKWRRAINAVHSQAGADFNALKARSGAEAAKGTEPPKSQALDLLDTIYDKKEVPQKVLDELADLPTDDSPKARKEIYKFLRRQVRESGNDTEWMNRYIRANMLSNFPGVSMTITMNNIAMAALRAPELAVEGTLARVMGNKTRRPTEAIDYAAGLIHGAPQGARRTLFALANGFTEADIAGEIQKPYAEFAGGGKNPYNWPGRVASGFDELVRAPVEEGEIYALAARQARKDVMAEGLKGQPAAKRKAELTEFYRRNPTKEMRDTAQGKGKQVAMQEELPKLMRQFDLTKFFGEYHLPFARGKWKNETWRPGNSIFPFMRTAFNVTKEFLKRTPAGLTRLPAAIKAGNTDKVAEIAAQAAVGTIPILAWLEYAEQGGITAGWPNDEGKRETMRNANVPQYSIKIGSRWFDYRKLGPAAFPLIAAAAYAQAAREKKKAPDDSAVAHVAARLGRYMFDQSFLTGINSLFELVNNPDQQDIGGVMANIAGQFIPMSGAQRALTQGTDPYWREAKSFEDRLKSINPVTSRLLPTRLNPLGQPVKRTTAGDPLAVLTGLKKDTPEPVWDELYKAGIGMTMPEKTIEVEKRGQPPVRRQIKPEDRRTLTEKRGTQTGKIMERIVGRDSFQTADEARKSKMLDRVKGRTNKQAESFRNRLRRQYSQEAQ